jgi:hypothetical protein
MEKGKHWAAYMEMYETRETRGDAIEEKKRVPGAER